MQNKRIIAAIILSIAAIFSLVHGITASPKGNGRAVLNPETANKNEAIQPIGNAAPVKVKRNSAKTKFTSWGRNPFMLASAAVDVSEKLVLNGILWDEKKPMAIINDEIKKIGDKAGENTIIGITQNKVILNGSAGNFELRLVQ